MSGLGDVAIVGAGQVGTMVGAALVSAGVASVGIFDIDGAVAELSVTLGGAHRALADAEDALEADTIVLAMPVTQIVGWLEHFGPRLRPEQRVLDTGSAKAAVVAAMTRHVPQSVRAVGGHPLVGNESSGPEAAVPEALRGVPFVLTPFRPDRVAVERARSLVELLGAVPLVMDAATHDRLVARTSHLPHLVANALASMAARPGQDLVLTRALAGPGYRSSTRLAASDCRMVADFVSANRDQVDAALQEFRRELDRLAAALASGPATLEEELSWGRVARALVLGPA